MNIHLFLKAFRLTTCIIFTTSYTWAAPPSLQIGTPRILGTNCSSQNSSVALSPDGNELSLIYDDYRVGTDRSQNLKSSHCTLILPLTLPAGYHLKITKADYRGFNSLPEKSSSEFLAEYRFEGEVNQETRKKIKFNGPLLNEFYETHTVHSKSPCSTQVNLLINTLLSIESKNLNENAFLQVDTLDVSQPYRKKDRKTRFQLSLKKCSEG